MADQHAGLEEVLSIGKRGTKESEEREGLVKGEDLEEEEKEEENLRERRRRRRKTTS